MIAAAWLSSFAGLVAGLSSGAKPLSVVCSLVLIGLCVRGIVREAERRA